MSNTAITMLFRGRRLGHRVVTHVRALLFGRRFVAGRRRWRPHAPPIWPLSNHLRRDIGLPPIGGSGF